MLPAAVHRPSRGRLDPFVTRACQPGLQSGCQMCSAAALGSAAPLHAPAAAAPPAANTPVGNSLQNPSVGYCSAWSVRGKGGLIVDFGNAKVNSARGGGSKAAASSWGWLQAAGVSASSCRRAAGVPVAWPQSAAHIMARLGCAWYGRKGSGCCACAVKAAQAVLSTGAACARASGAPLCQFGRTHFHVQITRGVCVPRRSSAAAETRPRQRPCSGC